MSVSIGALPEQVSGSGACRKEYHAAKIQERKELKAKLKLEKAKASGKEVPAKVPCFCPGLSAGMVGAFEKPEEVTEFKEGMILHLSGVSAEGTRREDIKDVLQAKDHKVIWIWFPSALLLVRRTVHDSWVYLHRYQQGETEADVMFAGEAGEARRAWEAVSTDDALTIKDTAVCRLSLPTLSVHRLPFGSR